MILFEFFSNLTHLFVPSRIHVYVRCRPLNSREKAAKESAIVDVFADQVSIRGRSHDDEAAKTFNFDGAFGPQSTQTDVFSKVLEPTVDEVLAGFNCTVFAYGQTGTGKTFTMEGGLEGGAAWSADHAQSGMIPRAVNQIFKNLEHNIDIEYSVRVSHMELYNEELIDLLAVEGSSVKALKMLEHPTNGVAIHNLEELPVNSADAIFKILRKSNKRRTTAATNLNAASSRSHCIFTITVHTKETTLDGEEVIRVGKLNLVDLAGSENVGRSGVNGGNKREAGMINQSLLTLGRVITSLVQERPHIPYRESKLTRLLAESLGGRAKTSIIATIAPTGGNLEETLSTLGYANTAKNITNKPQHNNTLTKKTLIKDYTAEIERLKQRVLAAREKNGVYVPPEEHERMEAEISANREKVAEFEAQLEMKTAQLDELSTMFSNTRIELKQTEGILSETTNQLEETKTKLNATESTLSAKAQELHGLSAVVAERTKTEEELHINATKILDTLEEREVDVEGLHAKIERKVTVDGANMQITADFQSYLGERMEGIGSKVSDHASSHEEDLCQLRGQMTEFMQQKASDFDSMCERVDALQNMLLSQKENMTSLLARETSKQEATLEHIGQAEQLERARAFEALAEYATSATLAVEEWRAAMQEQRSSTAAWAEVSAAQIQASRASAEQWTVKHVTELEELGSVSDENNRENAMWGDEHEEQLQSFQENLTVASEEGKKTLLAQIASIFGTFVNDGSAELAAVEHNMLTSVADERVRVAEEGAMAAMALEEHQQAVETRRTELNVALGELTDETATKVSSDVARIAEDQERSGNWSASVQTMQTKCDETHVANALGLAEESEKTREATSNFQRDQADEAEQTRKQAQEWNEDTQGFVLFVGESVSSLNYGVDSELSECHKGLQAWSSRMDADVAGISDRFGNFFYALKEDQATGSTPVKRELPVPRDLPISMPREQIVEAYWDRQLNGTPIEEEFQQEEAPMSPYSEPGAQMSPYSEPVAQMSPYQEQEAAEFDEESNSNTPAAESMSGPECTPMSVNQNNDSSVNMSSERAMTPLANLSMAIENARLTLSAAKSEIDAEMDASEEASEAASEEVAELEQEVVESEAESEEQEQEQEEQEEEEQEEEQEEENQAPTPFKPGFRRGAPKPELIKKLTVKDLQAYMKTEGLSTTGKKAVLIERIVDYLAIVN